MSHNFFKCQFFVSVRIEEGVGGREKTMTNFLSFEIDKRCYIKNIIG